MVGGRLPDPGPDARCARCDNQRKLHGGPKQLGRCPGTAGLRAPRFQLREEDKPPVRPVMTGLNGLARTTNTTSHHRQDYHITVAQLRMLLADMPDDAVVVLAKDAEGNGYSPLALPVEAAWYVPRSTWAGDTYSLTPDEAEDAYDPHEPCGDELLAVVLGPIN